MRCGRPSNGWTCTAASGRTASIAWTCGCGTARIAAPMADEYGISITRTFDAPRERVWREWTEPASFADWYGGADSDVPLDTVSMDVRPGGSWRLTMFYPRGGREIRWEGTYLVVE